MLYSDKLLSIIPKFPHQANFENKVQRPNFPLPSPFVFLIYMMFFACCPFFYSYHSLKRYKESRQGMGQKEGFFVRNV